MTIPSSISQTNTNKCPHGFPVGACPICSGMTGSVSKDKNKPRVPGEMSYNECLAEWRRMQAQKNEKLQEKIDKKNEFLARLFSIKEVFTNEKLSSLQDKVVQNLDKMPKIIKFPIKLAVNFLFNTLKTAINLTNKTLNLIFNLKENTLNFINSITEKLPTLLFEIKKNTLFVFEKLLINPAKTILNLFIGKENKDENKKDKNKEKLKRILEKIFKLTFKEKDEDITD